MSEPLLVPRERAAVPFAATDFALFSLGFRPFYLLASAFSVLLWAVQYSGWLPSAYLSIISVVRKRRTYPGGIGAGALTSSTFIGMASLWSLQM